METRTPEEIRLINVHIDGWEAHLYGMTMRRNPYPVGTSEYRIWQAGYLQARHMRREQEAAHAMGLE